MKNEKLISSDVSLIEDLIFTIKNMIGLEEHLKNSYDLSQDKKYAEYLDFVRKARTKYLAVVKDKFDFQNWCSSKHCLAVAMGLTEIGNRFVSTSQLDIAQDVFHDGNDFEKLFMIINDLDKEVKNVSTNKTQTSSA